MANISIGGVTPDSNPSSLTVIKAAKSSAIVKTITSATQFNWGTVLPGSPITARWDLMRETDFAALDALMDADGTKVLNSQNGSTKTYNVWLVSFDGEYHLEIGDGDSTSVYRKDVVLEMILESEVGA
jgi:hypothetical protein